MCKNVLRLAYISLFYWWNFDDMILFRIKFINGSVDNKKRDLELQQAIYSITFRFFHYSTCLFFWWYIILLFVYGVVPLLRMYRNRALCTHMTNKTWLIFFLTNNLSQTITCHTKPKCALLETVCICRILWGRTILVFLRHILCIGLASYCSLFA